MNDPRTKEEKKKAEKLANALRELADMVEGSTIQNRELEIHQFATRKEKEANWADYKQTGNITVQLNLSLYNPNLDEERHYEHLKNKSK